MGYIAIWALFNRDQVPASDISMSFMQKLYESPPDSCGDPDRPGAGRVHTGVATATEAAALGVAGALGLAAWERSLSWQKFTEGLVMPAACTA